MDPIARKARNYRNAAGKSHSESGSYARVYFGIDGREMILVGGGDKDTQASDIRKAKECWEDYNA